MFEFLKKNDFFKSFFPQEKSGKTARERLRLVLLSDHIALAPEVIAALKAELLEVIARYVDIDPAQADVSFEQREREIAMLASVPIVGVRRDRPAPPSPRPRAVGVSRAQATTSPRRRRRKRTTPAGTTPSEKPASENGAVSRPEATPEP